MTKPFWIPPHRPAWTTARNSDVCSENPRGSEYYSHFETREECEAWVKKRGCKPGWVCFDGANWGHCVGTGDGLQQTDLGTIAFVFHFTVAPGTTELRKEPDWKDMLERIKTSLRAPQRNVVVDGFVDPDAALEPAAREKLARSRAELVRRRLVARGVAPKRIVVRVGDLEAMRVRGYQGPFDLVEVGFEPAGPVREDFDPSSDEYRLWCDTLPR